MRAPRLRSVLLLVLPLCAGCLGAGSDGGADGGADGRPQGGPSTAGAASWQRSDAPLTADVLPFAVDGTVHVGDERIDTGAALATFVVAGDGVYFVADEDPDDGFLPQSGAGELQFADADGEVVETGVEILLTSLRASPDGHHLAALDMASGEKDAFGTPQAALVVWDLAAGEEVVRGTEATGDPDEDDLAALYSELNMHIASIDDDGLVLEASSTWVYDFATGGGERVNDHVEFSSSLDAPAGEWRLDGRGREQTMLGPGGARVKPDLDPARLELFGWVDATTSYGVLNGDPEVLVTCVVPTGTCTELDGTAGQRVVLPAGLSEPGLDLTGQSDD
ncbi:hypothetical protein KG112_14680 [Nocardioides sp. zg-ZUI104]|uniref:hypothetical protein n=1 Tax=Nocardioides faecalis TaxID=2803858 RepID=UPI001BD013F5|nr:hypothetical protein [Nocardioides faecalis]MBS4754057.1 hypothetical protein [Nocardioides faecalis]